MNYEAPKNQESLKLDETWQLLACAEREIQSLYQTLLSKLV
jgi:hypothetical protein